MDLKVIEHVDCHLHPERQYRYICLASECKENPKSCIICVRDKHNSCDHEQIVEINEFHKRIVIQNKQSINMQSIRDYIKDLIDVGQIDLLTKMNRKKSYLTKYYCSRQETILNSLTNEQIKSVYDRFIWQYNQDTDRIQFYGAASLDQQLVKSSVGLYKREFQKHLNEFLTSLSKIDIKISSISSNCFDYDSSRIVINTANSGLVISNNSGYDDERSAVIFKYKLTNNTFKIKITGLSSNDQFLEMGIMPLSSYRLLMQEKDPHQIDSSSLKTISFDGLNMHNMKVTKGSNTSYQLNNTYWLQFNEIAHEMTIYDHNNFKLSNTHPLQKEDYYFYLVIKDEGTKCEISID